MRTLLACLALFTLLAMAGCPPETIDITHLGKGVDDIELAVGESAQLLYRLSPPQALSGGIIWETTRPTVAIVSDEGLATGISEGTAEITASAAIGGANDSCNHASDGSVSRCGRGRSRYAHRTGPHRRDLSVRGDRVPDERDGSIVAVGIRGSVGSDGGSTGLVSGVSEGTATITVTTNDGSVVRIGVPTRFV